MTEATQPDPGSMARALLEFYQNHGPAWEGRLRAAATDWAMRREGGTFMSLWHFADGSELVETASFTALEPVQ